MVDFVVAMILSHDSNFVFMMCKATLSTGVLKPQLGQLLWHELQKHTFVLHNCLCNSIRFTHRLVLKSLIQCRSNTSVCTCKPISSSSIMIFARWARWRDVAIALFPGPALYSFYHLQYKTNKRKMDGEVWKQGSVACAYVHTQLNPFPFLCQAFQKFSCLT